jgi:hypothetical protein
MGEKRYYVSWVDKRTDPWPQWEKFQDATGTVSLAGKSVELLPAEHARWPGVPFVQEETAPLTLADGRMGQFVWPGLPFEDNGRQGRLYLGPTLSALFHPGSRFCDLQSLDRVYLLFQPQLADSPHALLHQVLKRICQARRIQAEKLQLVPVPGITDPTHYEQIINALQKWLRGDDPFSFGARHAAKTSIRVTVNLSPGTPAMHAVWLLLRWNGALDKPQSVIEYVQGDSGLQTQDTPRDPLRIVPIDVLAQLLGQKAVAVTATPVDETGVNLEDLRGPPFDKLRLDIEHAALLGLPILLQGERGTGKTYLARYYHQRRQFYRQQRATAHRKAKAEDEGRRSRPGKSAAVRYPAKISDNNFVTVTLSEFADLDNLRDTLFGWAKGSWNLAHESYDGLLGEAHEGTLFLDEIHHLDKALQAALLGPLNNRRYRPKMATYEITTDFDLVVASNDPRWREKMADDFRDRIERIVLEVPSFRTLQGFGVDTIWTFWDFTIRRRCQECGIDYKEVGDDWPRCRDRLLKEFRRHPLPGNWRDLQRLADNLLLKLTRARDGRPTLLQWDESALDDAIHETLVRE